MVNIFNTVLRSFFRGAKELKEEGEGSEIFSTTKGGTPKKLNRKQGGLLKFEASSVNISIPPPPPLVILNELSLEAFNSRTIFFLRWVSFEYNNC